jgi:hypothetical protein
MALQPVCSMFTILNFFCQIPQEKDTLVGGYTPCTFLSGMCEGQAQSWVESKLDLLGGIIPEACSNVSSFGKVESDGHGRWQGRWNDKSELVYLARCVSVCNCATTTLVIEDI